MHGEAGGGRGGGSDNDNIYIYINRYRSSSSQVILLRNSSLCLSAAEWPLSPAAAQYYYYARETSNNSFGATTASYAAFLSLYTHTHTYILTAGRASGLRHTRTFILCLQVSFR